MIQHIYPDDLDTSPYKEQIQSLAFQWVRAELPADGLIYIDYIRDISILLLTIQNLDRTTAIVKAVLDQATEFTKTSLWVEEELKFEGMIDGADRADFLLLDLQQATNVDDNYLDLYNERLKRFPTTS